MGMSEQIKAMMEADVASTVEDWSATLTYQGSETIGTFSPLGKGDDIEAEGILETADAEFVAVTSGFSTVPPPNAVVDVDGVKYWVQSVTDDTAAVSLTLRRN